MKATTRNAKKAAAAIDFAGHIAVHASEITVWVHDLDYDAAELVAESLARTFDCTMMALGGRFQVNYKTTSADMGDWNDAASAHHY